jgi:hypothetical protein
MNKLSTITTFLVSSIFVTSMLGCDVDLSGGDLHGGGWVHSPADRTEKATFGFHMNCDEETGEVTGHVQWHDATSNVDFHADIVWPLYECSNEAAIESLLGGGYSGTYQAQPKKLGGGEIEVYMVDGGEPGPDEQDYIYLELLGGPFKGYTAGGQVGGGNVTVN